MTLLRNIVGRKTERTIISCQPTATPIVPVGNGLGEGYFQPFACLPFTCGSEENEKPTLYISAQVPSSNRTLLKSSHGVADYYKEWCANKTV